MKKILVFIVAAIMTFSLLSCGGTDTSAVADNFNKVNGELTKVSTLANENLDKIDQSAIDDLTKIANQMAGYKEEIESDDIAQERAGATADEYIANTEETVVACEGAWAEIEAQL